MIVCLVCTAADSNCCYPQPYDFWPVTNTNFNHGTVASVNYVGDATLYDIINIIIETIVTTQHYATHNSVKTVIVDARTVTEYWDPSADAERQRASADAGRQKESDWYHSIHKVPNEGHSTFGKFSVESS